MSFINPFSPPACVEMKHPLHRRRNISGFWTYVCCTEEGFPSSTDSRVCALGVQAGLQRTLPRVLLPGVQRAVQPLLRPVRILSQRHVHRPDQPHVCLCGQPPRMVRVPPQPLRCVCILLVLVLVALIPHNRSHLWEFGSAICGSSVGLASLTLVFIKLKHLLLITVGLCVPEE